MQRIIATIILLLLAAFTAHGFEPAFRDRVPEIPAGAQYLSEPCHPDTEWADIWNRLWFWYSWNDPRYPEKLMSCATFRKLTAACIDTYGFGAWMKFECADCLIFTAMGSERISRMLSDERTVWNRSLNRLIHFNEPFDDKTIERVTQFVRVMHGISRKNKNPLRTRSYLKRWQARLEREGGNPRTQTSRAAIKAASRRARYDP